MEFARLFPDIELKVYGAWDRIVEEIDETEVRITSTTFVPAEHGLGDEGQGGDRRQLSTQARVLDTDHLRRNRIGPGPTRG